MWRHLLEKCESKYWNNSLANKHLLCPSCPGPSTVDSQKIVWSRFCEFSENQFLRIWSASYTLKVAALIIANFKITQSFTNLQYKLVLEKSGQSNVHMLFV